MFLTLMVVGLVGLVMMAIPAFGNQGHAPPGVGHGGALGHGPVSSALLGAGRAASHAPTNHPMTASSSSLPKEIVPADDARGSGALRLIPSPRAVFSVLALYGAFGNAFLHAAHLPFLGAVLAAAVPAILIERFAVKPLWNLVFRFQGKESAPLETLVLCEATAVTAFRNGKGIVSVVRDGRLVQFAASLSEEQARFPVKVGDRLRIEDVDAKLERLVVSVDEKRS